MDVQHVESFREKVKKRIPKNLQGGIPLKVFPDHTVRLQVTEEPLTVPTGLSLFQAMAEAEAKLAERTFFY